jgi:hypothetical protein
VAVVAAGLHLVDQLPFLRGSWGWGAAHDQVALPEVAAAVVCVPVGPSATLMLIVGA